MYHSVKFGHATRFNPTTNGGLHLGHVYIALFNEYEAHQNGEKFLVRFEDNQPEWVNIFGIPKSRQFAWDMVESLDWLQIGVDEYSYQSEMVDEVFEFARSRHAIVPRYTWPHAAPLNPTLANQMPPMVGHWYSYTPYFTFCKVILDHIQNVSVLIRGDDLRSEFTLYLHYADMLGIERPMHYYMPRLKMSDGSGLAKHLGALTINDYRRAGFDPDKLLDLLAESALKNPDDGWFVGNVKEYPRLVEELETLTD